MAAAGNSRFAVTCGMLRQYMMREQKHGQSQPQMGCLAGSFLREATEDVEQTDARTMQLFPTRAGTPESSQKHFVCRPEEPAMRAPLTIFYEGRVLVFKDFPADKAKELMQLAGSGSSPALKNEVPVVPRKPTATEASAVPSDLPIARKASLTRFLQKRKHRIIDTDPYHKEIAPEKQTATAVRKPVKDEHASLRLAL